MRIVSSFGLGRKGPVKSASANAVRLDNDIGPGAREVTAAGAAGVARRALSSLGRGGADYFARFHGLGGRTDAEGTEA
jgi:hypothetical protein